MPGRFIVAAVACLPLVAADGVRQSLHRLAEEASVFRSSAPDMLAVETLRQRAIKPVRKRFRPTLSAPEPYQPEWQTREIVSEYGYARTGGPNAFLREFRRPKSIDGTPLPDSRNSLDQLTAVIRGNDEKSRRKLLEDFEKLGLIGTATDFGQLLLMFVHDNQDNFEYKAAPPQMNGADPVNVVIYRQITAAPGTGITVWSENGAQTSQRTTGEIWCRQSDGLPVRVTIATVVGEGRKAIRQEAAVDYAMGTFGVLVPVSVVHQEFRAGGLTAENRFSYSSFRKFGSSSMLSFEPSQSR